MQINSVANNTNFKGYRNVMARKIRGEAGDLSVISMQLDNKGVKDLKIWQNIQKKCNITSDVSNVLTFGLISSPNKKPSIFAGEGNPLSPELFKQGSPQENLILKIFTLIASLTKRLENDVDPFMTNKVYNVAEKAIDNLEFLSPNRKIREIFVYDKDFLADHQNESTKINNAIDEKMMDYFSS